MNDKSVILCAVAVYLDMGRNISNCSEAVRVTTY